MPTDSARRTATVRVLALVAAASSAAADRSGAQAPPPAASVAERAPTVVALRVRVARDSAGGAPVDAATVRSGRVGAQTDAHLGRRVPGAGEQTFQTELGVARAFVNLENLTNVRQTRYDPLLLPSRGPGGRWAADAWTELAGFTVNGGVRLGF